MTILGAFYQLLLHLYPRPFRDEFGPEMEAVFQEQMIEAAFHGRLAVLQACWHELRDWPTQCFQAHWQVRQERLRLRSVAPSSWGDSAVARAPYFLFALLLSSSMFIFLFGQPIGFFALLLIGYGFVFLLLLVLIIAWWRGWPDWSVAWLGFLFFILLVLILPTALVSFLEQSSLQIIVTEVGLPLLWLAVLYVLLGRWPRAGMVVMLPTFGLAWFLYLEFVPQMVSTAAMVITWAWLGIMAMVLLRGRHPAWDVWLLYLAAFVTCLISIYTGHFLTEPQVRDGTLLTLSDDLLSELLPTLVPLVGILLLHTLRLWGQVNGRTAVTNCRLLLAAVLLMLLGVQVNLQLSWRTNSLAWQGGIGVWFTAVFLMGFLLMAVAIWRLAHGRSRDKQIELTWSFWLLIGLIMLIPVLYQIEAWSVFYGSWLYAQGAQDFQNTAEMIRLNGRVLELAWLLLAAWVMGRVHSQLPTAPPQQVKTTMLETAVSPPSHNKMAKRQGFYLVAGLLMLLTLLLPATNLAIPFPNGGGDPFAMATVFPLFLLQAAALIIVAGPLASSFHLFQAGRPNTAILFGSLSVLLLATAVRNFYWLTVWDNTYDPLGYFWLFFPILGIFFATIWLALALPDKVKWVSALYLLLIPVLMTMASTHAQRVDFRQLTDARAWRVNQAIEAYHAQENHYPENLRQLTPRYLLFLPEPIIIFGQDWCYDGSTDNYRLGYVYREHWSDPRLVGRIYESTYYNNTASTNLQPFCEQEITALQAHDPHYYGLRNE